jgi:hypothetical protein
MRSGIKRKRKVKEGTIWRENGRGSKEKAGKIGRRNKKGRRNGLFN